MNHLLFIKIFIYALFFRSGLKHFVTTTRNIKKGRDVMIDYVIKEMHNPLSAIKVDLGVDLPLWQYIKKAVQDIEVLNILGLYRVKDSNMDPPFIHVTNWKWNPHPLAAEIQYRRRETGDKLSTKSIGDVRIGVLEFDIFCGAQDKNRNIVKEVVHNKLYIPIEDEHGNYLIENKLYSEYQLVDKLLYPSGKDSFTLKSLLPVVIRYEDATEASMDGYIVNSKIGMVKIFTTMEPILACFMHVAAPLCYLGVYPVLQFSDHVREQDKDDYEYFQPIPDRDIYIKAYRKGLERFEYVRSILVMAMSLIRRYNPESIEELRSPEWWVYQLSYYDSIIDEHRGACHEMHVARMLDTISANVLPIPDIDKRNMIALLRYVLQTQFNDVNIYSYENKRLRLNEVISTIVTAEVSEKLKKMFKYGMHLKMTDMQPIVKFRPELVLKNIYKLGTVHVTDFANDLDYPQFLKYTKKGPNSLGRLDNHKINFAHRQLHPSMIGQVDLLDSTKDVGQSGMISPWADVSTISDVDTNKYPNIKYDLFRFIQEEFPNPAVRFHCDNIKEYNNILDRLVWHAYMNVDFKVNSEGVA